MTDVLVVGYGSDLRRDDAAGRHVSEAIARRRIPGVTVLTCTQLVPEHVEAMAAADHVVFVDAAVDTHEVSVGPLTSRTPPASSHHANPSELLELARALGLPCPRALLVGVPAFDLSLGDGLSAAASVAVEEAIDEVDRLIRSLSSEREPARLDRSAGPG